MKTDHEVRCMMNERRNGKTQAQAAARAGMSVRTARKYERLAQLPSQIKQPRGRTRPNPFAEDWPWVLAQLETVPRVRGHHQQRIDYHHLIDALVRKPGAFAQYRYRDEFFPSPLFRQAYDVLCRSHPRRADQRYLRVLQLAATTTESEVEVALSLLLESGTAPTSEAVRALVCPHEQPVVPDNLTAGIRKADRYDPLW